MFGIKKFFRRFRKKIRPVIISTDQTNSLNGRCAVVTGGSSGIGFAISKAFVNAGCKVIIIGRNEERLTEASKKINNQNVITYKMDVSKYDELKNCFERIETIAGSKIDILVNNAGQSCQTRFPYIDEKEFDNILNVNLKSLVFMTQEFANYMIHRGIAGNILNIGSSSGLRPANSAYAISKWGVRGYTLGTAKALIKYGIVVNGIAPGPTATHMLTNDVNDLNGPKNDAKRLVHVDEIASLAVHLVSNSSRMIIGEMVNINGGSGTLSLDDIDY